MIDYVVRRVIASSSPTLALVGRKIDAPGPVHDGRTFITLRDRAGLRLDEFGPGARPSRPDHPHVTRSVARVQFEQAFIDAAELLDREVTIVNPKQPEG